MDNPQSSDNRKLTPEQLLAEARQEVAKPESAEKPMKAMTDADAQALLATHNLHATQQPKSKIPFGMLAAVVTLIVLAILASFVVGVLRPSAASKSSGSSSSSSQSNSPANSTSNQIDQYQKSCSNPATAISEC
jgi:hypothetical protein